MGHLGSGSWRAVFAQGIGCRAISAIVYTTGLSRVESLLEQYSAHAYPRSPAADSAKKVSDLVAQPQVMVRAPNPGCKDLLRVAKVFIISCTAAGGSAQRVHSVPAVGDFRHDTTLRCAALRCAALRCTALSEILRYDFVPSHCVSKPLGDLPVSQPLCPGLHCIILHWIILHYIPLNCIALNCIALNCIKLHCITIYSLI